MKNIFSLAGEAAYCTVCSAVFENIAPITVQIKHKIALKSVQFSIIPISYTPWRDQWRMQERSVKQLER